jgi:hypothetical protein
MRTAQGQHLLSAIIAAIASTTQTCPPTTIRFDRASSAVATAHHVGDKIHSQTLVVDSGATRHMFYDLSVFQKLEFIAPTTVKLGDDSFTDCIQIGEVVLDVPDGRRIRLT